MLKELQKNHLSTKRKALQSVRLSFFYSYKFNLDLKLCSKKLQFHFLGDKRSMAPQFKIKIIYAKGIAKIKKRLFSG
jgi:hypothetical protein